MNNPQKLSGKANMIETVLLILGIRDLDSISPSILLKDIGMDMYKRHQIKLSLEQGFGIELYEDELEPMTIGKVCNLSQEIQQFQECLNRNGKIEPNKLLNFKYYIGLGEDKIRSEFADTIFYELQSKCPNLNIDSCAVLLPGIDSDVSHWPKITYNFHFSTFIVKYGNVEKNVQILANGILKDIEKLCPLKSSFLLIGYSFGTLIAIELARTLEKLHKQVRIVCIDGSPLLFELVLYNSNNYVNGDSLDLELATQIAHKIHPTIFPDKFRHQLKWFKSWHHKVDCLTDLTRILNLNIPEDNFQNICRGLFNRTYAAARYESKPNQCIHSPIMLIKPNEETYSGISYDYGLKFCTNGIVDVKVVQGNHYTILQNSGVTNLINELCLKMLFN